MPAILIRQECALGLSECVALLEERLVGAGNVVEMDSEDAIGMAIPRSC
jgi:hypothetical protein